MECGCSDVVCARCHGGKKLVLGVLVLLWVWKWSMLDWRWVVGGLLVLMGVLKMVMPMCGHCGDKKKK